MKKQDYHTILKVLFKRHLTFSVDIQIDSINLYKISNQGKPPTVMFTKVKNTPDKYLLRMDSFSIFTNELYVMSSEELNLILKHNK